MHEPRLADARVADDGDDLREPAAQPLEAGHDLAELGVAADERRQLAGAPRRTRRPALGRALDHERVHRLALALHVERADRARLEAAAQERVGRVRDEDRARLRERLEPRRQVRGVAGRGVVHLELVADGAGDHHTRVYADARAQRHAALRLEALGEPAELALDRERRQHRALGRVLVRDRRAEQRHQAVARELVHDAFEAVDLAEHELEVLADDLAVLLGVEPLGERRRADQIAEEHGRALALARDRARGADPLGEGLGNVARQARHARVLGHGSGGGRGRRARPARPPAPRQRPARARSRDRSASPARAASRSSRTARAQMHRRQRRTSCRAGAPYRTAYSASSIDLRLAPPPRQAACEIRCRSP